MNSAVITIKAPLSLKTEAQIIAEELGFSLSALINAYLRQLTRTKTVFFSFLDREKPTNFLLQSLKNSQNDINTGKTSPSFNTANEALEWLKASRHKYAN